MKKYSRHDDNLAWKARTGQLKGRSVGRARAAGPVDAKYRAQRHAGITLVPADAPLLLQAALASEGPIGPGDTFEHFLAVTNDNMRFYAYHFIIAPGAGGPRRAVLLSDRVVHGNVLHTERFAHQLADYARALGTPRLAIDAISACSPLPFWLKQIIPSQPWRDTSMSRRPDSDTDRARHQDCYTVALERFKRAEQAGAVRYPFQHSVSELIREAGQKLDHAGRFYLAGIRTYGMHPDLTALLTVYMDELSEQAL